MKSFTLPSGRDYLTVRSSNPDPSRRYAVTLSDDFSTGVEGLREMAQWLNDFADEVDPPKKKTSKAAPKAAPKKASKGGDE